MPECCDEGWQCRRYMPFSWFQGLKLSRSVIFNQRCRVSRFERLTKLVLCSCINLMCFSNCLNWRSTGPLPYGVRSSTFGEGYFVGSVFSEGQLAGFYSLFDWIDSCTYAVFLGADTFRNLVFELIALAMASPVILIELWITSIEWGQFSVRHLWCEFGDGRAVSAHAHLILPAGP